MHPTWATGYLLACSTQPSSGVVQRLEAITTNASNPITALYWDATIIERLLSTPRHWSIAQRFLPKSAGSWRIYATDRPNDFVAHYKEYVIHLTNRVGSQAEHHLKSVKIGIRELEAVSLPSDHLLRPRALFRDDKNGVSYHWYIDYMHPVGTRPEYSEAEILTKLNDGWALDDGQMHTWDVKFVQYFPMSDHYDRDHYQYYVQYLPNFLGGAPREAHDWTEYYATKQQIADLEKELMEKRDHAFNAMVLSFRKLDFVTVMRAANVQIEHVHRFERRFVWTDIVEELGIDVAHLFDALLVLRTSDEARLHKLLLELPIDIDGHFRISRVYVYVPGRSLAEKDEIIYDLKLSLHPHLITNRIATRAAFDSYFDQVRDAVEKFAN